MQRFGGAEPFDDLKTGERLPAVEHLGGQHLGGRQRLEKPSGLEIIEGLG